MTAEYFLALLVACIGAYFVWLNNFKVRQAAAASVFRGIFNKTLSDLRNTSIDTYTILERDFVSHESAVLEFRRFLCLKRNAFLDAWYEYAYYEDIKKHPFPFLEKYTGGDIHERKHLRNLAIKNIEHLISFAKQV